MSFVNECAVNALMMPLRVRSIHRFRHAIARSTGLSIYFIIKTKHLHASMSRRKSRADFKHAHVPHPPPAFRPLPPATFSNSGPWFLSLPCPPCHLPLHISHQVCQETVKHQADYMSRLSVNVSPSSQKYSRYNVCYTVCYDVGQTA